MQQEKYTYLITVLDVNGDTHEFTGIVNVIYYVAHYTMLCFVYNTNNHT